MDKTTTHSIAESYDRYVLGNYPRQPLTLVRGEGIRVWDDEGRSYLDFTTGLAVNALGHAHPEWVRSVAEQAGRLTHVSNLYRNEKQALLAEKLVSLIAPGRVFFCNSGAEANEALFKLARLHGNRKSGREGGCTRIIAAKKAFHGRTFAGMSATPQEKIQQGFRPLAPNFAFAELNDLESFREQIDDETCAVLIETIQGEGGIHVATDEFLRGLRRLCDEHDLLLMLDEVQCGIGRSGRMFAFEESGVLPDAIGMAKALGGGFPIGGIWVKTPLDALFTPGTHAATFGGNPLACAAALATLRIIEDEGLLERIRRNVRQWHPALMGLVKEFPRHLVEFRGRGYLVGLQFREDPGPHQAALREAGILCPVAGDRVLRLLPPLNASIDDLMESVSLLRTHLNGCTAD